MLDADLWAGRERGARATASWSRPSDGIAFRHAVDRPCRGARPAADRPDPLSRGPGDEPRRTAVGRRLALAGRPRPAAGPGRGHRGGRLRRRSARRRRRAGLARARAVAPGQARRRPARRPAPAPQPSDRVDLQVRASEAAFAVGQMSRATAYLEAAIGGLDARRDRVPLGLLHERLAHHPARRRRPGRGDAGGPPRGRARPARPSRRNGPRSSPRSPSSRCSTASSPRRSGSPARRSGSRAPATRSPAQPGGPRHDDARGRAGLGQRPERRDRAAPRGRGRPPSELDDPDALFRIRANLTTVLDLVEPAGRGGRRRVRRRSRTPSGPASRRSTATSWRATSPTRCSCSAAGRRPGPISRPGDELAAGRRRLPRRPSSQLAIVEIETDAGEDGVAAARPDGPEFDAVREPQLAGPYYLAAASFALWRGDVADASRSVDRGWASVRETEEWVLVARMAAMVAQVDAAIGGRGAPATASSPPLAAARQRTAEVRRGGAAELVRAGGRADDGRLAPGRRGVAGHGPRVPASARGRGRPARLAARRARRGPRSTRRTTWRWRAGARPRRSSGRRPGGRAGRTPRRRCSRRSSSGCGSARSRSCASCASWPAGPGSRSRPRSTPLLARSSRRRAVGRRPRPGRDGRWLRPARRSAQRPLRPRPRRSPATRPAPRQRPDTFGLSGREREVLGAGRPGPDEPRDRGAAVHQPEDGRRPRREHPRQARGLGSGRGRRRRDPAGADRARADTRGSCAPRRRETRREVSGSRSGSRDTSSDKARRGAMKGSC